MVLLMLVLCALLYAGVTSGSVPAAKEQWNISTISPTAYTYASDDGRLFIFDGNDVYAIRDGALQWQYTVPAGWSVINLFYDIDWDPYIRQYYKGPVFESAGDTLYLYAMPDPYVTGPWFEDSIRKSWDGSYNDSKSDEKLMAISDGKLLWEQQLPKGTHEYDAFGGTSYDNIGITAVGDRLYLYHPNNLTVMQADDI